jgi:hypothetical protein
MAHTTHTFQESVAEGGKYHAKQGMAHDSNNGTTPDTPIVTWDTNTVTITAYARVHVIGAGHYRTSNLLGPPTTGGGAGGANASQIFKGDGKVIIDQLGSAGKLYPPTCLHNIHIKNGSSNTNSSGTSNLARGQWFRNAIVENYELTNLGTNGNDLVVVSGYLHRYEFTIFINSAYVSTVTAGSPAVYRSGILNSVLKGNTVAGGVYRVSRLINSYVHNDVVIQINIASGAPVPQTQWSDPSLLNQLGYSNIRGLILMQSTYYAVQDAMTGTPQDNGYASGVRWLNESELTSAGFTGTIGGWNALVATLMNRDPGFINITDNYFGLVSTSPHIGAGYDGTNIGGTRISGFVGVNEDGVGNKTVILSAEMNDTDPEDVFLDLTEEEGTVRFIDYVSGPMGKIDIDIDYLFDSDESGGDEHNNNVPDAEPAINDYPTQDLTVANGTTTTYIVDNAGSPSIGMRTVVLGEVRTITNVEADTPTAGQKRVTVGTAFRASINSGTIVTYGTADQVALMKPNRLCILMRFSSNAVGTPPSPSTDSDWDNFGLGTPGEYYLQELEKIPGIYTIAGNQYGAGDSLRPSGGVFKGVSNCWAEAKVVLINRYSHLGK